jgi:hypothetical protein
MDVPMANTMLCPGAMLDHLISFDETFWWFRARRLNQLLHPESNGGGVEFESSSHGFSHHFAHDNCGNPLIGSQLQ